MISPVSMASVSNVHFGENSILEREGKYAKKASDAALVAEPEKKKSSTGKKLAITAVIIAAALAALAIASRNTKVLKTLTEEELKNAKWTQKLAHHLGNFGEKIASWTWDPLKGLFKKGEKVAEAVGDAAEKTAEAVAK